MGAAIEIIESTNDTPDAKQDAQTKMLGSTWSQSNDTPRKTDTASQHIPHVTLSDAQSQILGSPTWSFDQNKPDTGGALAVSEALSRSKSGIEVTADAAKLEKQLAQKYEPVETGGKQNDVLIAKKEGKETRVGIDSGHGEVFGTNAENGRVTRMSMADFVKADEHTKADGAAEIVRYRRRDAILQDLVIMPVQARLKEDWNDYQNTPAECQPTLPGSTRLQSLKK